MADVSADHLIAALAFSGESKGWMICLCGWDGPQEELSRHRNSVLTKEVAQKKLRPAPSEYNRSRYPNRGTAISITGIAKAD